MHGITKHMPMRVMSRSGEIVLRATITEFKACAVQVFPAREDELPNPEVVVQRGRY